MEFTKLEINSDGYPYCPECGVIFDHPDDKDKEGDECPECKHKGQ